ncbi:MAG: nitroreductase family protein, partial [Nitrososphaeraceae archaeon]|nr:nitroreductase family protein [Nitrososphaeraceae archaeon]
EVEDYKIELILAAADTAPTAGGFQGFEIFHLTNNQLKSELVKAANNQPYVNAPLVLVFCKNPTRVKLNFPEDILRKFSLQDATLAAAYAQLASHALGLSSIWIGMIDENMVMKILNTDLVPSSILCIGYPKKILQPKPKRSLKDLIHRV